MMTLAEHLILEEPVAIGEDLCLVEPIVLGLKKEIYMQDNRRS
jgi:hypothetical protein